MGWRLLTLIAVLWGQDTVKKPWRVEALLGLQAAQTALSNWQAGGQNQLGAGLQGHLKGLYARRRYTFSVDLSGQYGVLRVVPQRTYRKTQDFALLVMQAERSFQEEGRVALSLLADARTQWAPSYAYVGDSVVKPATSAFLAPLYGQFAVGLRYRPVKGWSLVFSPLSGRVTWVRLQYLADAGAFGLPPAERDSAGQVVRPARQALWEAGGRFTSRLALTPVKGLQVSHFLDAFGSYTQRPWGPVVVSQLQAAYALRKWLAITLTQQALYDPRLPRAQRLQLLTSWSLALTYTMSP